MGKNKTKLSAKRRMNARKRLKSANKVQEKLKVTRIQKQIQSDLSPKFTAMKTGARISRFGRPQKQSMQDVNSIPTEIAKFIPKHSPKRLKAKDFDHDREVSENEADVEESQLSGKDETSSRKENIPLDDVLSRPASTDLTFKLAEPEELSLKPVDDESASKTENNNEINEKKEDLDEGDMSELKEIPEDSFDEVIPIHTEAVGNPGSSVSSYPEKPLLEEEEPQPDVEMKEEPAKTSKPVITYNLDDSTIASEKRESLGNHSDAASDTDSALGSASSHNDMKEENFCPGDILWGSFSRVSWYPCMVYPDAEGNIINAQGKSKQIHVKYFNWNGCTAHLPLKNVFELKSLDDFWQQIVNLKIKKSKIKPFAKSCYKAIEEANFFKKYQVDERIKIFDEILKVQLDKKMRLTSLEKETAQEEEKPSASKKPAERKSVDSALECSVSPRPSSPNYDDPAMKADPIEIYLQSMMQYEAKRNQGTKSETKRVRRQTIKTEVPDVDPTEDSFNCRRSNREVKKRKFEDYEEVGIIDSVPKTSKSTATTSDAQVEQKVKRSKISQEETLQDRFVVDLKLLRMKFKSFSKKRVCMECHNLTSEPTYRCNGNGAIKCSGWFHQKCSGHFEQKREEIRHVAGDSEEIIQTQAIITTVMCKACNACVKNCFVCQENVDLEDQVETQHCMNQDCRLTFHKKCLSLWPQIRISKGNNTNNNKKNNNCPQHTCHSCFFKDIHKSGTLTKCVKCPAAYHTELTCIPAGTVFLSQTQIICPRHPSVKEIARNAKENIKPLNVDFCNLCPDNGKLVCCDTCPHAFHYDCIGYEETEENFICQECREGRLPLYNTIVWARVGTYRWWPALVMHDFSVPVKVLKTQKFEREFCVRFFGSYDFFYTTCERVLMYGGSNLSVKTGSSRLDSAFNLALEEAHEMAKLLEVEDADDTMNAKPKPYTKIVVNRPVPPVKIKKVDEHTKSPCNCKADHDNPCGRNSDCINMHVNIECDGDTCPAKDKCQNRKLQKREYAEVRVVKTHTRGFGAISVKDIPEDTFIIEYVGELIDSTEFQRRMKQKIKNKEKEFYFLTIEGDLYVDAEPAGNLARFINHSCDPNCVTRKITVDGNTRIGIFSNQLIKAGTELTFDYQMEFVDNKKTACFCGSSKCSGLIGNKPIVPEKKLTNVHKRKAKRKNSGFKIQLPEPKRKRTMRDTIDPFDALLEDMKGESPAVRDIAEGEKVVPVHKDEEDSSTAVEATISDDSVEFTPIEKEMQAPVKFASPLDFHVAGDSHLEEL